MADALDKIRKGADTARRALAKQRLGGREFEVVVERYTPGDPVSGRGGSYGNPITLDPRPAIKFGAVRRPVNGVVEKIGDATLTGISRSYNSDQILGVERPTRYTIDGVTYTAVQGDARPTEWRVILKRD